MGVAGRLAKALIPLALAVNVQSSLADVGTVHRIGYLSFATAAEDELLHVPFAKGLAEGGYIEGKNLVVERRFVPNDPSRIPGMLAELIALRVEVLVTVSTVASVAAKNTTSTVPIVAVSGDPVGAGLVTNLGRPGGNVTALTTLARGLAGKRLALLREIAPRTRQVAVVWNPDNHSARLQVTEVRAAATELGLRLHLVPIQRRDGVDRMLASFPRVDAIVLAEDPVIDLEQTRIGTFAIQNRLPMVCSYRLPDDDSCLLWYGPDLLAIVQRAGVYAGRILAGSKPGDLPVEQPTRFLLSINARTASALGIAIPPSLLAIADNVIR
jgi:putative ABC transport system substrate-binding protein